MGTALGVVAGLAVAALAVWLVLEPVLRPPAALGRPLPLGSEEGWGDEDDSPRARALRALKEIEFDRETGKLDDADYRALKAKYTALALQAPREATRCPSCGPRPEGDAIFCSNCGRRLPAAA